MIVKEIIRPIRNQMPSYGTRKLYNDVKLNLKKHNVDMGRDKFFQTLKRKSLVGKKDQKIPYYHGFQTLLLYITKPYQRP